MELEAFAGSEQRTGEATYTSRARRLSHVSAASSVNRCNNVWLRKLQVMRMLWVTAIWAVIAAVNGHLDLFMNETETKRLLGEYVILGRVTVTTESSINTCA